MKKMADYIFPFNALLCFVALCVVAYTVFVLNWKPCPMCLLQQLCVFCIMLISLIGWLKNKPKSFALSIELITIIIIIFGAYVAADQTYIQYFSSAQVSTSGTCGGMSTPLLIDVTKSITGTVENCADTYEKISGLSLAVYSLIFFIFLLVINCVCFLAKVFNFKK